MQRTRTGFHTYNTTQYKDYKMFCVQIYIFTQHKKIADGGGRKRSEVNQRRCHKQNLLARKIIFIIFKSRQDFNLLEEYSVAS